MSRAATYPASTTGYARVALRTGRVYVGRASYDGRAVTGSMSLRVIVNGVVEYRPPRRRTIPLHTIRDIFWDEQ
jgi:hypothetical protein